MQTLNGHLVCSASAMDFSEVLAAELKALVSDPPRTPVNSEVRWGGPYYCPADGATMAEANGIVMCPTCGRSLTPRMIYQLIEFHVHP